MLLLSSTGPPRIHTASLLEQCGELMSSARGHLTQAVQLATTTAMEKHVAAELHYSLAFQGIFDQLWKLFLERGLSFDLMLQFCTMPAEEQRKAVGWMEFMTSLRARWVVSES